MAPELVSGVLREGHKMLIVGGSKTGKSFLLIEFCLAVASGRSWIGWKCAQGRVLYVNLELDRNSCLHRFKDVCEAAGVPREAFQQLDIWNLRGRTESIDKLVPKLVRRAKKHSYKAIVIDPIYKVLTGDENSAEQMAKFCNQFDRIATETGAAVVYVHHHSKGAQGGKKSMDRASGSGVFGRDPDALLDLIELPLTEDAKRQTMRSAALEAGSEWLRENHKDVWADLPQAHDFNMVEDYYNAVKERTGFTDWLEDFGSIMRAAEDEADGYTGLRVDGTLREFKRFKPVDIWFKHPIHEVDETGMLQDIKPDEGSRSRSNRQLQKSGKRAKTQEELQQDRDEQLSQTFDMLDVEGRGMVAIDDLLKALGKEGKPMARSTFFSKNWFDANKEKFEKQGSLIIKKNLK